MTQDRAVTQDQIVAGLRALGVKPTDLLLVHSSLSSFGHVEGGAGAVIDALLDAVGQEGTVAVPTHTWDRINARNPVFDFRTTPCGVGLIPETFRKRPEALRGLHPTHSCAAIGPQADALLRDHERDITPCGARSPYQRLMRWGGKIAFLGVNLRVNTTCHALEETACVPWVFDKFEMLYTVDRQGRKVPVPSRRHMLRLWRRFDEMNPFLERGGALVQGRIGQAEVLVLDAGRMEQVLAPLLAEDPFLLLARGDAERERARYDAWRHSTDR